MLFIFKGWLGVPKTTHVVGRERELRWCGSCLFTLGFSMEWNIGTFVVIKGPIGGAGTCGASLAAGLFVIKIGFIIRGTISDAAVHKMAATSIKISW